MVNKKMIRTGLIFALLAMGNIAAGEVHSEAFLRVPPDAVSRSIAGAGLAYPIGAVALFSLFLLGLFVWSGFLMWAIIVFFLAGSKSAPPLNDLSLLGSRRVVVGAIAFILLFLILMPVPHTFYQSLGIHCPYV